MGIRNIFLSLIVSFILFTGTANAIDLKPTKKQVKDAVEYGEANSKGIFDTQMLKKATYGRWPDSDGGFVKTKLNMLAVLAAMNARRDKKLTEEDINEVLKSDELEILGGVRLEVGAFPKDIYIELKQGDKVIKPKKIEEGIKMRENWSSVNAIFPYSSIDPKAKTIILFKVDADVTEYEMDFSTIR